MYIEETKGVPGFEVTELKQKKTKYCVLIPIINEKENIELELKRAINSKSIDYADIIICDGNSTDGSNDPEFLKNLGVTTLLVKITKGKQGAQLRMGFDWAIKQGYEGFITIDGNNKDSIEDVPLFVKKLDEGYDFIQGSRFIKGGQEINTPKFRKIMVKCIHAPIISLTAHKRYTDTTNAYRAYSKRYITDEKVDIFRNIFNGYELLAYTSTRANQLKYKSCEVPVKREYPEGKVPTKIKGIKGNFDLLKVLFLNLFGYYKPKKIAKRHMNGFIYSFIGIALLFLFLSIFTLNSNIKNYSKKYEEYTEVQDVEKLEELKKDGINKAPTIILGTIAIASMVGALHFYDLKQQLDEKD